MTLLGLETAIVDWLLEVERLEEDPTKLHEGLADQLQAGGASLLTFSTLVRTMHPQLEMLAQRWRRQDVAEIESKSSDFLVSQRNISGHSGIIDTYLFAHGHSQESLWRTSPFYALQTQKEPVRWRAASHQGKSRFAIFDELEQRGATDYLAVPLPLQHPFVGGMSFSTDAPEGFAQGFEDTILRLAPVMGLISGYRLERLTFTELLAAYLGRQPGHLVYQGQVRRGQVNRVRAIIGFANLRGYRSRVGQLNATEQIQKLDDFYRKLYKAVTRCGGDILKFIGDVVLYTFPLADGDQTDHCENALRATQSFLASDSLSLARCGLCTTAALHVGEVSQGNIGSEGRLDFTVLGEAVNLAARLQQLSERLGHRLVLSGPFASLVSSPTEPIGPFELKGVSRPQAVHLVPH